MLDSLFSSSGGGINVYITISPANGLEIIAVDKSGVVKAYANEPLEYNFAQREIADYSVFKDKLEALFDAKNINPAKANVHLSLPTVWFGLKEGLPLLLDDSAITNVVLGELEQSFIFKRKEPLSYWFDALLSTKSDSRSVFYTAIQQNAVEQIKGFLTTMGANLVSVECSLFGYLKALYSTGIGAEFMQDGHSWSFMIVNNSGFQMIGLQGRKILEYYEEPLPLASYEGDEIYSAIENAAQIALMSTPSTSLVVLSETDLVSAEFLAGKLQFGGSIYFIEDNQFRKEPFADLGVNLSPEDNLKVSLHAIGTIAAQESWPITVNFIEDKSKKNTALAIIEIPIGDKIFELTPPKATIIMTILFVLIMLPFGVGYILANRMIANTANTIIELDTKITELDNQLKSFENNPKKDVFDPVLEIERVLKNNRLKIMSYQAIGESITGNMYLTYFLTGADGKINIKGCANSVEEVYSFFKNMKEGLIDANLRISKLDLKNESIDDVIDSSISPLDNAPYVFEITNMSDAELTAFSGKNNSKKTDDNGANDEE